MPGRSGNIYFHYLVKPFFFPNRSFTKNFIKTIFHEHNRKIQNINFIFCSDAYLLKLNKKHLNHNYYTDIITFDLSVTEKISADIFISIDRMRKNASKFEVSRLSEILRLLIHGTLHLCGYADKSAVEFERMKFLEELYLHKYSVSRET